VVVDLVVDVIVDAAVAVGDYSDGRWSQLVRIVLHYNVFSGHPYRSDKVQNAIPVQSLLRSWETIYSAHRRCRWV